MWVVSGVNAFVMTFCAGLLAGFALGVHAVGGGVSLFVAALALAAIVGAASFRALGRR
jgi:hypothetical protein